MFAIFGVLPAACVRGKGDGICGGDDPSSILSTRTLNLNLIPYFTNLNPYFDTGGDDPSSILSTRI